MTQRPAIKGCGSYAQVRVFFFRYKGIERRGPTRSSSGCRKRERRVRGESKTTDLHVRPFDNDLFHPLLQAVLAQLTGEVVL